MGEGRWHKKVRDKISRNLDSKNIEYRHSHGANKVPLFLDKKVLTRSTQLSDADFVVLKEDAVRYIIEIETGAPTPKKIIGIICATDLSEVCSKGDTPIRIEKAKLFIITQKRETNKPGSRKSKQYENIQSYLKVGRALREFQIITENEIPDLIREIEIGINK